jgi:hypothetical protein
MSSASPEQTIAVPINRPAPTARPPVWQDYLLYFIGIPVGLAVVFSLVGIRLTYGMPYLDALIYMLLHMFTAWWTVNMGAYVIKYSFRSWRPPALSVCLLGLLIALLPAAFLFQMLGDFYANLYPVFATNRADQITPNWNIDYLMHFVRYSFPVLPTFLAGVYGYRYATGVDWFGYPRDVEAQTDDSETAGDPAIIPACIGLIEGSKLPAEAEILAIKAEQHYIQIWSDQGAELVRYRFKDIAKTLAKCNGGQVHRSWWANFDKVQSYGNVGRKVELIMNDELSVPVSLAYKNAVLDKLEARKES